MRITLSLRSDRADKGGQAPIHGSVCWINQRVRFATGEWVQPRQWDATHQQIRPQHPSAKKSNRRLRILCDALEDLFDEAATLPSKEQVSQTIERIKVEVLGHTPKKKAAVVQSTPSPPAYPGPAQFLTRYAEDMRGARSGSSVRQISVIVHHLEVFKSGLDWADLRVNTLNQLKAYWVEECALSDNTVATYMGTLTGALKYAQQMGYPVPADYVLVTTRPVEVIRPSLSARHLALLEEVDLTPNSGTWGGNQTGRAYNQVRWLFLLACYTGLRHSDLKQLRQANVRIVDGHPCLMALQQKSAPPVAVPLTEPALRLLDQHPDGVPPLNLRQYNAHLREIARLAGLDEPATVSSRYKGQLIHDVLPLWQTITSHTARRTFANLLTEGGLATRVLQELMGHSSIASTERYIKLSSPVVVGQTVEAFRRAEGRAA